MKIEINKKYTSGGKPIRILCTDRGSETYPIVGMRNNLDIAYFTEDGKCVTGEEYNLIEEWEPKRGEWCLFSDETFIGARLMQFSNNLFDKFQALGEQHNFRHCDRFTGELPEHLKGK
jgi:hypothetical protein